MVTFKLVAPFPVSSQGATVTLTVPHLHSRGLAGLHVLLLVTFLEGGTRVHCHKQPLPPVGWGAGVGHGREPGLGAVFRTEAPPACYPKGLLGWCHNWNRPHWSPKPCT